jgi:hypothetical protein
VAELDARSAASKSKSPSETSTALALYKRINNHHTSFLSIGDIESVSETVLTLAETIGQLEDKIEEEKDQMSQLEAQLDGKDIICQQYEEQVQDIDRAVQSASDVKAARMVAQRLVDLSEQVKLSKLEAMRYRRQVTVLQEEKQLLERLNLAKESELRELENNAAEMEGALVQRQDETRAHLAASMDLQKGSKGQQLAFMALGGVHNLGLLSPSKLIDQILYGNNDDDVLSHQGGGGGDDGPSVHFGGGGSDGGGSESKADSSDATSDQSLRPLQPLGSKGASSGGGRRKSVMYQGARISRDVVAEAAVAVDPVQAVMGSLALGGAGGGGLDMSSLGDITGDVDIDKLVAKVQAADAKSLDALSKLKAAQASEKALNREVGDLRMQVKPTKRHHHHHNNHRRHNHNHHQSQLPQLTSPPQSSLSHTHHPPPPQPSPPPPPGTGEGGAGGSPLEPTGCGRRVQHVHQRWGWRQWRRRQ